MNHSIESLFLFLTESILWKTLVSCQVQRISAQRFELKLVQSPKDSAMENRVNKPGNLPGNVKVFRIKLCPQTLPPRFPQLTRGLFHARIS